MRPGHHLVNDAPQRPHVALVVVRLVLAQLRGQVVRRAHQRLGKVNRVRHHLGDAEVPNLRVAVLVEEYVLSLDVPVQNLEAVYVVQPQRGLQRESPHDILRQRLGLGALHQRVHRPLGRVLHHDAQPVARRDEGFVIPDDVRVIELGEDAALVDGLLLVPARGAHRDLLHHVGPLPLLGISPARHRVDHAEGPFPELALDLEVLQPGGVGPRRHDDRWLGHPGGERGHALVVGREHHATSRCVCRKNKSS